MSEGHTAGPWDQQDNEILSPDGIVVATVMFADDFPCISGDSDQEEAEERARVDLQCDANARLIAAAPELLEALRPFVFGEPVLEKILFGDLPDDATGTITVKNGDFRRARAVLDKLHHATGHDPQPARDEEGR